MSRSSGLSAEDKAAIMAAEALRRQQLQQQQQTQELAKQTKMTEAAKTTVTPSIPTFTGAEREKNIISPTITQKVTEIKVKRTQQQLQQLEQTKPIVQDTIQKLDENISRVSGSPGKGKTWMITDPNTGQLRKLKGNDIDRLKQQKADLESWVKTADETKPILEEYETYLKAPKTTTKETKYTVTYDDEKGENTKNFDTKEEATEFVATRRQTAERRLEQIFQGLSLEEQAEVILQERKGEKPQSLVRGSVNIGPGDTQRLEELIEHGDVAPQQLIQWGKEGKTQVSILIPSEAKGKSITIEQAVKKVEKIVSDDITLLLASGNKKLVDIPGASTKKRGTPLTEEEWSQALARADAFKDYAVAGVVLGAATILSPKTWVNLPKDAVELVKTPLPVTIANTAAAAAMVAASYEANPVGTSGLLLGSVIGSSLAMKALVPAASAAFKYGVQKPVTIVQGKLMSTTQYKKLAAASTNFYNEVSKVVPSYGQLNTQLGKELGIPINTVDPTTKTSLLKLPLWDTYRQFKKLDFTYVPADPTMATISNINEYTEFLKIKLEYLKLAAKQGFDKTSLGEFVSLGGLSTSGLKYKSIPENYGVLHQARLWANLNALSIKDPVLAEKYAGAVAALLKRGEHLSPFDFGAVSDYPKTSAAQQAEVVQKLKDFWRQFDPNGDYPMPTPWEQEEAIKVWRSLMNPDNEYGAVNVEANALYTTLLEKGVSKAKATEVASDYATALTIVSVMRTASPEETQRYLQHLAIVMDRLGGSGLPLGYDAVTDVVNRLTKGLNDNDFKGLSVFVERAEEIQRNLDKTGELDAEKYSSLLKDLMNEINSEIPDTVEDTIDKVVPIVVPIDDVSIIEVPDTKLDEITEVIEETEKIEEDLGGGRRQRRVGSKRKGTPHLNQEKKSRFRVVFTFPRRIRETLKVPADNYVTALQLAQRGRKPRRDLPTEVNIWPP